MKYARIQIHKERMEMKEKSVPIRICATYANQEDDLVYAPKSRVIVEGEVDTGCTHPDVMILVPLWVFFKNSLEPWKADTFIEIVER